MYLTNTNPNYPYILLQKMYNAGYGKWACEMEAVVQSREAIIQETINEDQWYDTLLRTKNI